MKRGIKKVIKLIHTLNSVDWVIIIIFLGISIFLALSSIKKVKWIDITFKVQVTPATITYNGETPPYWITGKIKAGDMQYDSFSRPNLKIKSVRSWGTAAQDTWISASVKVKSVPNKMTYTFVYQPLEIGRPIEAVINGTYIRGVITTIEGLSDTRPIHTILIKTRLIDFGSPYSVYTRGIDPWIANAVQTGQVMKDSEGQIVAEFTDKVEKPAERVVTTNDGRIFIGEDPLKKDVYLSIKLKVNKNNDTYFFLEDKPVKIGFSIPIYLDNVFLTPVITEILTQ